MKPQLDVDAIDSYDDNTLLFYVNGKRVEVSDVDPRTVLVVYLRDHLGLTGTKVGCNEGGCGACTVMISEVDIRDGAIRHYSANSCLMPLCAVHGKAVTTVEGIGSTRTKMHAVQERLAMAHGSQCGFCTPGFVMAMYSLLRNKPHPTEADINEAMQGNLCRCTGYRPILEAFYSFAVDEKGDMKVEKSGCGMGEKCCQKTGNGDCGSNGDTRKELLRFTDLSKCAAYDPTQECIFPPELKVKAYHERSFAYQWHDWTWWQPTTWGGLLELKRRHPYARIISGNSELAIELKFRFIDLPMAINPRQVPELHETRLSTTRGCYLATGLSLTEMDNQLVQYGKTLDAHQRGVFDAIHEMMHWFAGKHVRNVASVAGNIATASPISDLNPIWMAANAEVVLESEERGERSMPIDEKFFVGYRKTVIQPDEILKGVWVPLTNKDEHFAAYKQAQRREDDIAIVTGAFKADVDPKTHEIRSIRISYGGMAPTTKLALKTMELLQGKKWSHSMLDEALASISAEFPLPAGVPGGMPRYRQSLTLTFFFKFFMRVAQKLDIEEIADRHEKLYIGDTVPSKLHATQVHQEVAASQPASDAVGRPLPHASGLKHTTGEAIYFADQPVADCLHMAFVMAPIGCGQLESMDPTKALAVPGVHGFFDASSVRKGFRMGHAHDTPVFCDGEIAYHGQPLAAIVAVDHETARRAAALVDVKTTQRKAVVSIEDAIAADSYLLAEPFRVHSSLMKQDTVHEVDWSSYDRIVEGEIKMGGQEHFYLETQGCTAIPHEDDEMEIVASTQGVQDIQVEVAAALGVPQMKVNVRVRRIGGGFGGKESTGALFAVPAAIAAAKLRKPVRMSVERFDDMAISGTRHPYRANYKIGVSSDGQLQNLHVMNYLNAGHTFDLSIGVIHRAMTHVDNVYRWPNADIFGLMCKTNTASNTAYRGFGGPQGMFATETMMVHVAEEMSIDVDELRARNFYSEGDLTPFGMTLNRCNIRMTWDECRLESGYDARKAAVKKFNSENRYRKRGIFLLPTKFSCGFGLKHLNQAGALVLIYTDGTVLVNHAGMEMGQGLHTKMLQVTSRCLGIDMKLIHITETSTDKVPNTSPTAASMGSDLNGLAIQDACRQINERLAPLRAANPDLDWHKLIRLAYAERVSLSASGFAVTPCEPVNFSTGKGGELFSYAVYGTACCEVEVDCLTGDHYLLRSDIVMDIGETLNPAIDIGQIEGAFIQGYGLFTMEELKVRPDGIRLTRGPGAYKIPSADDAPREMHVRLLKGSSNPGAIFSSKAVGEPPLFLGSAVLFAIREAVKAYRQQCGLTGYFRFDSPATPERVRMACEDHLLNKVPALPEAGSYTPWTVPL